MNPTLKKYLGELVKWAAGAAVIVGLAPVILSAVGATGISVPAWTTTVISVVSGVLGAFLSWATEHDVTPATVLGLRPRRT